MVVGVLCLAWAGLGIAAPVRLTDGSAHGGSLGRAIGISPDGTRVVFTADPAGGGVAALYSVPIAGGPLTQLHGPTIEPANYPTTHRGAPFWMYGKSIFEVAPDGESVFYSAEPAVGSVDLYRTPITGGGSVRLASLSGDGVDTLMFRVAPDSGHLVFSVNWRASDGAGGPPTIYSTPAAGGQPPVMLFQPSGSGAVVVPGAPPAVISPDGRRVLIEDGNALYITAIGGGPVTTLATVGSRSVGGSQFTPDGARVLFTTFDPPIYSVMTSILYSVGVEGGSPVELLRQYDGPGPAPKGVKSGQVATIGGSAIIVARPSAGVTEFHRVAIDTGASTLLGTVTTGTERSLRKVAALHDATGGVFLGTSDSEATSLWYIAFSGGEPLRLTDDVPRADSYPPEMYPFLVRYLITPDDQRLVYALVTPEGQELYSVAVAGGESVRLDHDPLAGSYVLDYRLTPDGRYLIYGVGAPYTATPWVNYRVRGLYAVDVLGGTPWLMADSPAADQYILGDYQIAPDGTVVYWMGNSDTGFDLYSSAVPEAGTLCLLALAGVSLLRRPRGRGTAGD